MFDMVDFSAERSGDRIVIVLDPGEPIELGDLSSSFAALARMYERLYPRDDDSAPKLYLTKISTGSVIAEIAPFAAMMGGIALMDGANTVADFTKRLADGIKAFAGFGAAEVAPTVADTSDLREFVKPMLGKNGAKLGITHARYEKHTAEASVIATYDFDEAQLNRAAINMDHLLDALPPAMIDTSPKLTPMAGTIVLVSQASRGRGKAEGRTADRAILPELDGKLTVALHFAGDVDRLKETMLRGDLNPLGDRAFLVDGILRSEGGLPKSFLVTRVVQNVALP